MVSHDTEYIYTQGRVPVLYLNTVISQYSPILIHSVELPLLLRMENWRNFVKNRLLLGGHVIVNGIRAVELTVSYQTRVRPCLFCFIVRILFIFLLLLLFPRLLFLSNAFSLPLLPLLPFFCF